MGPRVKSDSQRAVHVAHTFFGVWSAFLRLFRAEKRARSEAFCVVSLGGGCDQVNGEAILIKLLQLE